MVYFAGKSLWRVSGSRWLSHHWRMTRWMELPPRKVLISEEVAFSLTSVHRFVHQPLSSFSFPTIECNKPEIILLSILSLLFCFLCKTVNHQVLVLPADGTTTLLICMFCDWKGSAGYSFLMVVLALCSIHHFDRKHFLVPIPIRKNASYQKFLFWKNLLLQV